jgi:long-chain acyl-CoA synthetase
MSQRNSVFYPRITKKPPFSVEVPGYEPVEGETIPRRNPKTVEKLKSRPEEDVATIFDVVKRSSEKFGNAKAVGSRKVLHVHNEVKKVKKVIDGQEQEVDKKWKYFELSEYSYITFHDYETLTLQLGAGFRKLGMNKDDRVHIFAATR